MGRLTIAALQAEVAERDAQIDDLQNRLMVRDDRINELSAEIRHQISRVHRLRSACAFYKSVRDYLAGVLEGYLKQEDAKLKPIKFAPTYEGAEPRVVERRVARPPEMTAEVTLPKEVRTTDQYTERHQMTTVDEPFDWLNV